MASAESVVVRAVDHGWKEMISRREAENGALRWLSEDFGDPPYMHICCISDLSKYYPHISETAILREILPIGAKFSMELEKSKGGPPHCVRILMTNGQNLLELVQQL
ncbi:hypothetical protein AB6A40_006243 [Gnathostoma spinigerum]|uniref:Uncharacterized protein n=1 Tax=Gnathostoma spinigerum TaxID=75299 RepID=A0ABD6EQG4_9BILA